MSLYGHQYSLLRTFTHFLICSSYFYIFLKHIESINICGYNHKNRNSDPKCFSTLTIFLKNCNNPSRPQGAVEHTGREAILASLGETRKCVWCTDFVHLSWKKRIFGLFLSWQKEEYEHFWSNWYRKLTKYSWKLIENVSLLCIGGWHVIKKLKKIKSIDCIVHLVRFPVYLGIFLLYLLPQTFVFHRILICFIFNVHKQNYQLRFCLFFCL